MKAPVPRVETRIEAQTFYHFQTLSPSELTRVRIGLNEAAEKHGIVGLIILGPEGLNATASGRPGELEAFVAAAGDLLLPGFRFSNIKSSWIEPGEKLPFLEFVVKVRTEIVTMHRPDLHPHEEHSPTHLSPEAWDQQLRDPNAVIIDTRNNYESSIGTFRGAITPDIEEFSELPEWLEKNEIPKDKPTYIFCTGGIRCERAIKSFEEKGFNKVYQLDGGILNYINHFPKSKNPDMLWDGECFVFDNRIAVDADGRASHQYSACPHCGQPADHSIFCPRCDAPAVLCDDCFTEQSSAQGATCSKNCRHHWSLHPGKKGKRQDPATMQPRKGASHLSGMHGSTKQD